MRITEKLVSQLQPGDVLAPADGPAYSYPRRVFGFTSPGAPTPAIVAGMLVLHTLDVDAAPSGQPRAPKPYECRPADAILRVEVPDCMLVPHEIEIVLEALGHALSQSRTSTEEDRFIDLRNRLKPAPPTLGDTLKALANLAEASSPSNLDAAMRLIQTARSAGVWPA